MPAINVNYYVKVPEPAPVLVPLWTQDGIAAHAVEIPQSAPGTYPANSSLTDGYYCVTNGMNQDGRFRIYVPAGYTIERFYQYGLGSWTDFNPSLYTRFETDNVEIDGNAYTEYAYYDIDGLDEPVYTIAAISFDVTRSNS